MTTALQILAAIIAALTLSALFGCVFGAFIDAGMHPRRGEGEQESSAHRDAKFNRSVLPSGSVHRHHGSVK